MRKILTFFLAVSLILLAGCTGYKESNSRYLVSAIAFDGDNETVTVSIEALIVGTGSTEDVPSTRIFSASGKTPEKAVKALSEVLVKEPLFDHCGIVAIGDGITPLKQKEIFDFCRKERDLNLSVSFVCAPNAAELISCDPVSSVATGYDIVELLEQVKQTTGLEFSNRFYEIDTALAESDQSYTVPRFTVLDGQFSQTDVCLFKGFSAVSLLDREAAAKREKEREKAYGKK